MTEENQEIDLHDDNDVVEAMTHDPKNAEAQSVASVDKAGEATGKAPTRKGDQTKQDPMIKTKAGLITAMVGMMQKKSKKDLHAMYDKANFDEDNFEGEAIAESPELDYEVDFSEDLNALVESEATLSDEFKAKAETIFEAAIKSKLSEEIDRLEEKYNTELAEEVESTKADLVEKVDNYLNYVVESWMEDNKLAVQSGLRTEIAENFMSSLKDLFEESYIEVPEAKVDLVDEMADQVSELEESLNDTTAKNIEMMGELEELKREKVIREASEDLAETQVEKLKSLVSDIDFDSEETFAEKVETVKESYFTKKVTETASIEEDVSDDDGVQVASGSMAQYLTAIQKTNK